MSRSIEKIAKNVRHTTYVPSKTLASWYFSLLNSYLCYEIISWGGASPTTGHKLITSETSAKEIC